MERLTRKTEEEFANNNGVYYISNASCRKIVHKLGELEDLEEQGKLIVLPCAEGDLIYLIKNNTDACCECDHFIEGCYEVEDWCNCNEVKGIPSCPQYSEEPLCNKQYFEIVERKSNISWIFNNRDLFKKTWFLDKKEAEKTLEEMEK